MNLRDNIENKVRKIEINLFNEIQEGVYNNNSKSVLHTRSVLYTRAYDIGYYQINFEVYKLKHEY